MRNERHIHALYGVLIMMLSFSALLSSPPVGTPADEKPHA
jgi:hypothetical protein